MIETLRTSLVTFVNPLWVTDYPTVPLVFDNQPFDWNNPPENFVTLELQFHAGLQIGMSATPKTRVRGYVYIMARAKEGTGSGKALAELAWFARTLGYQNAGALQFQAPAPVGNKTFKGWFMEEMKIPFYADET